MPLSGIVGIVNLDGAAVDRHLLRRMTDFLAFRGPDAQQIRSEGGVGFGHTMLRTTRESLRERQPTSLDGEVWITADARVDGRAELVRKLRSKGADSTGATPDPQLILQAYQVWGEQCVDQLLGDFAFAIWDGPRRRLFCARDHFGIKPFYYARVGDCLVFSNTLDCVRMHPAVSEELNDLAIADFLLFNYNQEPATTVFADIQRLPAAHFLTWSAGSPRIQRYWELPLEGPLRYKRTNEYVEHFRVLLRAAVGDRLRTERVGVFMSGGMDSSTVAATAKEVLSEQSVRFDLRAHTVVYDWLIPDEERYYSGRVAEALGIPVHYLNADGYTLYERWDQREVRAPDPAWHPLRAVQLDLLRQMASFCRVALTGEGGDPALQPSVAYFGRLLKKGRIDRIAWDLGACVFSQGRLPRVGFRTQLRRWVRLGPTHSNYPPWLNPSLAARLDLPGRWKQFHEPPPLTHPVRPETHATLLAPYWQGIFESYDPGTTLLPVEPRHPFFDLRVIGYLLALPAMPWSVDKLLLREAMRGVLPECVRLRRKAPVPRDPVLELLQRPEVRGVDQFEPAPTLGRYVDRRQVPKLAGENDSQRAGVNLRPLSLNLWLQMLALSIINIKP